MPKVTLDLITTDATTGEYVLYLVEDGPWPLDQKRLEVELTRIQNRILNAVDVVTGGHLAKKYPDSIKGKVRIQIDSPSGLPKRLEDLIERVKEFVLKDANYYSAVTESPYVAQLRIVTGHEIGRFAK